MNNKDNVSTTQKKQNKDDLAKAIIALLFVIIIVPSILGYLYRWEWVGVINIQTKTFKTLWDWMALLLIPGVFAIGAYLLNKSTKAHEDRIADKRATVEQELAKDLQRQNSLEAYFDKMTDLLLRNGLRTSCDGDEVRSIARTRTLTVLREIDGKRRGHVLQFLYELNLISGDKPILDMSFADLSEINLPYVNLENITLPKVNLRKAILSSAKLQRANFESADMDGVDLEWADLRNANLNCGLSEANLGVAMLDGATLYTANLNGANLINASLVGADLRYANFKYRNGVLKDIDKKNINPANLVMANMSHCDMTGAIIDPEQLNSVRSLSEAIMPNKMKYEKWRESIKNKPDNGKSFVS